MSANIVLDALLYLGNMQLKDGLYSEAVETFAAACILDNGDHRAAQGLDLARAQLTH